MKLIYKKIKMLMPHCENCGELLMGNNSIISPYRCSCGEWEQDNQTLEFNLKNEQLNFFQRSP